MSQSCFIFFSIFVCIVLNIVSGLYLPGLSPVVYCKEIDEKDNCKVYIVMVFIFMTIS